MSKTNDAHLGAGRQVDVDPGTGEVLSYETHPEFDEAAEAAFLSQEKEAPDDGTSEPTTDEPPPTVEELGVECHDLLHERSILLVVDSTLAASGFAGPTWPVQLLVLALYSRHLLDKPVSIVVRGESASGKSHAIKRAMEFVSPEAVYLFTAMSGKALYYDKADFAHKMLVVYEGEALKNETVAYAMRSLLSEGRLEYRVTDFETKSTITITKEGPSGLITSTAGRVDFELATRVLSIPTDDSPAITQAIMQAEASQAEGSADDVEPAPFVALDRWIGLNRAKIVVPFARKLSELTDGRAVRMRRDFSSVIGLVQTHALMHQVNRDRDADGKIIAEISDYQVVYELVSDLVAFASGESVPPHIRETVEAVWNLSLSNSKALVGVVEIAEELDLHRTSALRRLRHAESLGFVSSNQQKQGRANQYRLESRVPDDRAVLPHPDQLR